MNIFKCFKVFLIVLNIWNIVTSSKLDDFVKSIGDAKDHVEWLDSDIALNLDRGKRSVTIDQLLSRFDFDDEDEESRRVQLEGGDAWYQKFRNLECLHGGCPKKILRWKESRSQPEYYDDYDSRSDSSVHELKDQWEKTQNDLSHEADYKLSKVEQDAVEKSLPNTAWPVHHGNKRSTNEALMGKVKLKTSLRMLRRGNGPSLPSSIFDTKRPKIVADNSIVQYEKSPDVGKDNFQSVEGRRLLSVKDDGVDRSVGVPTMRNMKNTIVSDLKIKQSKKGPIQNVQLSTFSQTTNNNDISGLRIATSKFQQSGKQLQLSNIDHKSHPSHGKQFPEELPAFSSKTHSKTSEKLSKKRLTSVKPSLEMVHTDTLTTVTKRRLLSEKDCEASPVDAYFLEEEHISSPDRLNAFATIANVSRLLKNDSKFISDGALPRKDSTISNVSPTLADSHRLGELSITASQRFASVIHSGIQPENETQQILSEKVPESEEETSNGPRVGHTRKLLFVSDTNTAAFGTYLFKTSPEKERQVVLPTLNDDSYLIDPSGRRMYEVLTRETKSIPPVFDLENEPQEPRIVKYRRLPFLFHEKRSTVSIPKIPRLPTALRSKIRKSDNLKTGRFLSLIEPRQLRESVSFDNGPNYETQGIGMQVAGEISKPVPEIQQSNLGGRKLLSIADNTLTVGSQLLGPRFSTQPIAENNDDSKQQNMIASNLLNLAQSDSIEKRQDLGCDLEELQFHNTNTEGLPLNKKKSAFMSFSDELLHIPALLKLQQFLSGKSHEGLTNATVLKTTTSKPSTAKTSDLKSKDRDVNIKLHMSVNATVLGAKDLPDQFRKNTTIDFQTPVRTSSNVSRMFGTNVEDIFRDRRGIIFPVRRTGEHSTNDDISKSVIEATENFPLDELITGKLTSQVVRTIFSLVKKNPNLKPLWPGLKKNKVASRKQVDNFYAIRNHENESEMHRTEIMLRQAMETINAIIEQQVRSRSCVPLRSDLKSFYNLILASKAETDRSQDRRKRDETSYDPESINQSQIRKKSRIVKKLLKDYEELPQEDQEQVAAIKDRLLFAAEKLRHMEDIARRKKRHTTDHLFSLTNATDVELDPNLTPEYVKLAKTAEMLLHNTIKDSELPNFSYI